MVMLLKSAPTLQELKKVLSKHKIVSEKPNGIQGWETCGPAILLDYREEYNGLFVIDIIDKPWPDELDCEKPDSTLHKAWLEGCFGIATAPGSLERAVEHCWFWPEGRELVPQAKAFLRIRSTFMIDRDDWMEGDEWIPSDYYPADELQEFHMVIRDLFELPQVICYFNPQGEVLRDKETFIEYDDLCYDNEIPPLGLWANARFFKINDEWVMMDTVGNSQIEVLDVEACFHIDSYEPHDIDQLLRVVTLYQLEDDEFEGSDTVEDENGVSWKVSFEQDGLCDPPRRVIRLIPQDGREPPAELAASNSGLDPEDTEGE